MFVRESVQHCERCGEVTLHARRVVALPLLVSLALLAGAGSCILQGAAWWLGGGVLALTSLLVERWDRSRHWGIHCQRCRGKRVEERRRTRPTLDGNTEIHLF